MSDSITKRINEMFDSNFDNANYAHFDSMDAVALNCYEGRSIKRGDLRVPKESLTGKHNEDLATVQRMEKDKSYLHNILEHARLLPFAASVFDISPDLNDYVVVPVEIIRSEVPNKNGVGFPYEELARYNPFQGNLAYKTWRGKGAYVEHVKNREPDQAAGIILDVSFRRAPEFKGNFYRVNHLVAYDRNKRRDIASGILTRKRTGYSMGSTCCFYTCSICNANVNDMGGACEHIDASSARSRAMSMKPFGNMLAYSQPRGVTGIECSSVVVPANHTAVNSDYIWSPTENNTSRL